MALTDLLRFFIPISAIIAVFWCVSFIARISEPKPLFLVQMIIQYLGSIGYTKSL